MSRKERKTAHGALKRAGVNPHKADPETVRKVLEKDPRFQHKTFGGQIRREIRQSQGKSSGGKCWGACLLRRRGQKVRSR
jgi:hypothetical protein